jgi:hypothetical protein
MNNISYIMIHINESLSMESRSSLEAELRQVEGVVSPRFNADKEHFLTVAFNPEKTNAAVLLENARDAGLTAQLLGMTGRYVV